MATESIFAQVTISDPKVISKLLEPVQEPTKKEQRRLAEPLVAKRVNYQELKSMLTGKEEWLKSLS